MNSKFKMGCIESQVQPVDLNKLSVEEIIHIKTSEVDMIELTSSIRTKFQNFCKLAGKDELDFAEFSTVLKFIYKKITDKASMDIFKLVKDNKQD